MIWTVDTTRGPIVIREQIEPEDEPGILELFASCTDWFETVTGGPPGFADVQSLFYSLPEGATFDDKRLFTARDDHRIVALIDSVVGYPHRRACSIGMFLVASEYQGQGIGSAIARVLLDEARQCGLEMVVATANDAWPPSTSFVKSLGFVMDDTSSADSGQSAQPSSGTHRAVLTLM